MSVSTGDESRFQKTRQRETAMPQGWPGEAEESVSEAGGKRVSSGTNRLLK